MAAGGSPSVLIDEVEGQLTQLLSLQSCRFQYDIAGLGRPARLHHDGSVTTPGQGWDAGGGGLGTGRDLELLAESGEIVKGRFLMTCCPARVPRWSNGSWRSRSPARSAPRWPPGTPAGRFLCRLPVAPDLARVSC
jgi:hypothetical protein